MEDKILMIVQARSGSTRLPSKILRPFYGDATILQLMLRKLKGVDGAKVVVATTDNAADDVVADMARGESVDVFRGSENDVLQRFIDTAEKAGYQRLVRVCSDNPFLDMASVGSLIDVARANPDADYISFDINGTPSIKTHYGFWTEYVTLDALKRVKALTDENLYHEHVTNYIYAHPDTFAVRWIEGPGELLRGKPIRLTIDTPIDFENARKIYADLSAKGDFGLEDVVRYVTAHPALLEEMAKQIAGNSK